MFKHLRTTIFTAFISFAGSAVITAQTVDVNLLIDYKNDETGEQMLLNTNGKAFTSANDRFLTLDAEAAVLNAALTVTGDFDGDGSDEIARFYTFPYWPNGQDKFDCAKIVIYKANEQRMVPVGTWFSANTNDFSFGNIKLSLAADFNGDGKTDIALLYDNPGTQIESIFILESSGKGFDPMKTYYSNTRTNFNFRNIKTGFAGDFNKDGYSDIALCYNIAGTASTTRQTIHVFEGKKGGFNEFTPYLISTRATLDFNKLLFATTGDYNADGQPDIAMLFANSSDNKQTIQVAEGAAGSFSSPKIYFETTSDKYDFAKAKAMLSGSFGSGNTAGIALVYNNNNLKEQELLVFESAGKTFKLPLVFYAKPASDLAFDEILSATAGRFNPQKTVTATIWKDNKNGAISFTFDDGYKNAFDLAGAYLYSKNLCGTFYIITDTTLVYDGELVPRSTIKTYKNRGFDIGSHSDQHVALGDLYEDGNLKELDAQLKNSKNKLDLLLNQNTATLSMPFGNFSYGALDYISKYYLSARCSEWGFNLLTPFDFYALRSYPVLSTTTHAEIDSLLDACADYQLYLPIMYHDFAPGNFDRNTLIYTYSESDFKTDVDHALARSLWIDSHLNIVKYIKERNALNINDYKVNGNTASFKPDDGLDNTLYNVEITLKIAIPATFIQPKVTVAKNNKAKTMDVITKDGKKFVYFNCVPDNGEVRVIDGISSGTENITGQEISIGVSPNPFTHEGFITIKGGLTRNMKLLITDVNGRTVATIENPESRMPLKNNLLKPGIYMVRLTQYGTTMAVSKFIVW